MVVEGDKDPEIDYDAVRAEEEALKNSRPSPEPAPAPGRSPLDGPYIVMPQTSTYALGVHTLQDACSKDPTNTHPQFTLPSESRLYRPLTFKETIEARVNDYERHGSTAERLRLFQRWNDSCTGVGYKAGSTRFKIIPESVELITIEKEFNQEFLPVVYDSIPGIELDRSTGKYNTFLTKDEILFHPAWLAAVEGDAALLRTYRDIVFAEKAGSTQLMRFWVLQNTPTDELRALFVSNIDINSYANGNSNLSNGGCFLRVAHVVAS